jgi:hypothetical protein
MSFSAVGIMSSDFDDDRIRPARPDRGPQRPRARRDDDEAAAPPPKSCGTKVVLIVLGVVALFGCCCIGIPLGVVGYFGYQRYDAAQEKVTTSNNFKQIALGMHQHESEKMTFPPFLRTGLGLPGLSWRVAVLPYIDQQQLYKQFKLDEPWDSATNRPLAAKMPAIFAPRKGAGGELTHVRLIVGPQCVYDLTRPQPRRFAEISDGMGNTFLFVEAEQPVIWTKPEELAFDPKGKLPPLGLPEHDYFLVAFCDGSVRSIKKNANPENIKKAITAAGGENFDLNFP